MEIWIKTDSGRKWGSMFMFSGKKWVDTYEDIYVKLDKLYVSFGDLNEVTYPEEGEDVFVYGPSYNYTQSDIYRKVVEMVFRGYFEYFGEREFKVYDV